MRCAHCVARPEWHPGGSRRAHDHDHRPLQPAVGANGAEGWGSGALRPYLCFAWAVVVAPRVACGLRPGDSPVQREGRQLAMTFECVVRCGAVCGEQPPRAKQSRRCNITYLVPLSRLHTNFFRESPLALWMSVLQPHCSFTALRNGRDAPHLSPRLVFAPTHIMPLADLGRSDCWRCRGWWWSSSLIGDHFLPSRLREHVLTSPETDAPWKWDAGNSLHYTTSRGDRGDNASRGDGCHQGGSLNH